MENKKIILTYQGDDLYYLNLTTEQVRLMDWLFDNSIIEEDDWTITVIGDATKWREI